MKQWLRYWWLVALPVGLLVLAAFRPEPLVAGVGEPPGLAVPVMADVRHIPYVGAPHQPYTAVPPTSGPHVPQTIAPGVYRQPIPDQIQVRALEHSHVLIQYAPPPETIALLERIGRQHSRATVVVPYPALKAGIALTAWGRLLHLDHADPAQIETFIAALYGRYEHGWLRELLP